jgi:hypothetical protein
MRMMNRDGNFTHGYGYPRVPDPTGMSMGTKFFPRVLPVPDPRFGGYGHGYCLPPTGNPCISEIKSNPYLAQHSTGLVDILMTCLEDEEEEMVAFNSLVFIFLFYVY